jgi:hypothetical protein
MANLVADNDMAGLVDDNDKVSWRAGDGMSCFAADDDTECR